MLIEEEEPERGRYVIALVALAALFIIIGIVARDVLIVGCGVFWAWLAVVVRHGVIRESRVDGLMLVGTGIVFAGLGTLLYVNRAHIAATASTVGGRKGLYFWPILIVAGAVLTVQGVTKVIRSRKRTE